MTLAPESRVMLTDALRPPAGTRVEIAVGTTYSLNLTSLLLAPLTFAIFDETATSDAESVDPIRVLEAVRRHAGHTTVFCQAGGIHVPANYRSILTFVEDSVFEVMPPAHATLFHPKIWVLRFVDSEGNRTHRLVILSRNMTLDNSWDTLLTLDEADNGTIDAAPAADFVAGLAGLALKSLDTGRAAQIQDLVETIRRVRFAAPSPFSHGYLLPIGIEDVPVWPFPERAKRVLAISPFLTRPAVRALGALAQERTLISRQESIDMIGRRALEGWDVQVLQRLAEVSPSDDVSAPEVALTEYQGTVEGLHAKTFIVDEAGGRSMLVTGSANMTGAVWGGSVEFDAVMYGPTRDIGVARTLLGTDEAPGLIRILEQYVAQDEIGTTDAAVETSYLLEDFHRSIAVSGLRLDVKCVDDERVDAVLHIALPADTPGESRVWISSLPVDAHARPLVAESSWTIAPINITPFIAIETTAGAGDARITRRCVLKAELTGDVDGRRHTAVFDILKSKHDVLRYLVFLLGDPSYDALFAQLGGVGSGDHGFHAASTDADVALFEPLVRAAGRDDHALARVASLVDELRASPGGDELVPDGFDELWDAVWQVHCDRAMTEEKR